MNPAEILAKLVSFPTVSDQSNLEMVGWIQDFLLKQGACVEIVQNDQGKAGLWARLGPETDGGVILAGHMDVVPIEGQKWSTDPFTLCENNGRLYGRGSCDMKGFIACALAFATCAKGKDLPKPVHIALTYDEETTMAGAKHMAAFLQERGLHADSVWLGEPTELRAVTAHKGVVSYDITIRGIACHASMPHHGFSALAIANKIASWIFEQGTALARAPLGTSPFDPPYSTTNVGVIQGGKAPNIVPDFCEMKWESRIDPFDTAYDLPKTYQDFLNQTIAPLITKCPKATLESHQVILVPPFISGQVGALTQTLMNLAGQGKTDVVSYATEAGHFAPLASEVVICGPGSITKAHQPDEYVPVSDLTLCFSTMQEKLFND